MFTTLTVIVTPIIVITTTTATTIIATDSHMPDHDTFYVIRRDAGERGHVIVTVLHEVPDDAQQLGSFADPGAAIDFAQHEVGRLNAAGVASEYVDPPEDLVGTG
jgi:hypothetical protein